MLILKAIGVSLITLAIASYLLGLLRPAPTHHDEHEDF